MTRIIAGAHGGRRLVTPRGRATRPTADRVREAVFSVLGDLTGRTFLDLYAGSGAVGLEAASRGAAAVVLVESGPAALAAARANVDALGLADRVSVRGQQVERFLAAGPAEVLAAGADVVYVDPPYTLPIAETLLRLVEDGWLAPGAVVVVERAARDTPLAWPSGIEAQRSRRYGDTTLWYGRRP